MISFLLNDQLIHTGLAPGTILLDFIRYHRNLPGTKIGCREGDCGACTILSGTLQDEQVNYRSLTSCLVPLAIAHGKHIVTVEGINGKKLTAVQRAISDEAATQCGFCTPGIVMSLTGFCLQHEEKATASNPSKTAFASVDGNICRCTGYKSIERAAKQIGELMLERENETSLQFLVRKQVVPAYFGEVKDKLRAISNNLAFQKPVIGENPTFLGGGTDLYVQQHERMERTHGTYLSLRSEMESIVENGDRCIIGGVATVTGLMESPFFMKHFPDTNMFKKLVSSTPIRNMATISGNFVNASPIGDLTIFFLALDAELILSDGVRERTVKLRNFYKAYKTLDKSADEFIKEIGFNLPANALFNFEKVSKRTNLDIASVNSAILVETNIEGEITTIGLSAGGVGPIPLYLKKTCAYFLGKIVSPRVIHEAIGITLSEVSPISDTRGTAAYKKLLLQQLIKSHFIKLFPKLAVHEILMAPAY